MQAGIVHKCRSSAFTMWLRICFVAVLFTPGCLFEPREAEPPGQGSSWVVPDLPTKVFTNLESGLEELTGANYERSLGDQFTFIALSGDRTELGQEVYEGWTREVEVAVVQKLVGQASKIEVEFPVVTEVTGQGDFSQFDATYVLEVIFISVPPATITYRGKSRFDFRRGGRGWELIRWEDIEASPPDPTWGRLRGELRDL